MDWDRLNPKIIAEFRANEGRVERFGDQPVAILHTRGARTDRLREIPLMVVHDDGELLLYATAAGAKRQPGWVFNLRAHPRIEVELGSERFTADVVELDAAAAQRKIDAMAQAVPQFASYVASAAPRQVPVFAIRRVD